MKKTTSYARKSLFEKAFGNSLRLDLQKKVLLTVILVTNVLITSFSQKSSVLLSSYDSCQMQPPQQQISMAVKAAGVAPMLPHYGMRQGMPSVWDMTSGTIIRGLIHNH